MNTETLEVVKETMWIYIIVTQDDFTQVEYDRLTNCLQTVLYSQHFITSAKANRDLLCYTGIVSGELSSEQLQFLADEENNHKWFSWRVM